VQRDRKTGGRIRRGVTRMLVRKNSVGASVVGIVDEVSEELQVNVNSSIG